MAQIEGGDAADDDTGLGKETDDGSEPGSVDAFSAELEKVVQEADAAEQNDNQAAESNASEDETDDDAQDISDDIDDILKEITSSDDESNSVETAADELVVEPASADAPEKIIVDDDSAVHENEDPEPDHADGSPDLPPDDEKSKPTESQEKPSAKEPSDPPLTDGDPPSSNSPPPPTVAPLVEAPTTPRGPKKKAILASAGAVLLLVLAGYYYWFPQHIVDSEAPSPVNDTQPPDVVVDTQPALQPQAPLTVDRDSSDQSRLNTATQKLDQLRSELIEKQREIEELRAYYQAGIDAEIEDIVEMVRETGPGIISLKTAMANPRINLGLSAIQRRDTYIKKLVVPANGLFRNSEELLYFSRKAGILSLMAAKTSDIEIDGFVEQAERIMEAHGSALAQLNIDAVPASPPTLESIWQEIAKRLPAKPGKPVNKQSDTKTDNAAIWKDICDGDFTRKHQLTALSAQAARCLTTWKGRDLFLNGLTDLSAAAARQLIAWQGDWLGLNGLEDLSPEAATHLSRWPGKGLSLNGLSRLSPQVVAILSEWQGEQIELVNVKHMPHWENPNTRLFLSEALKRKGSKP